MAKLKTRKTAMKRFKLTRTGKVVREKKGWNHLRSKKKKQVRTRKRGKRKLGEHMIKRVKKMMLS